MLIRQELATPVYEMDVEVTSGNVVPHGFHLGTDLRVAETFVIERLQQGALTVRLHIGGKTVKLYDFRDLPGWRDEHEGDE